MENIFDYYKILAELHNEKKSEKRITEIFSDFFAWCGIAKNKNPYYLENDQMLRLFEEYVNDETLGSLKNRASRSQ